MKSPHSVKILAAEIEKLFISTLKGKTIPQWRLFVLWGRNLTFVSFCVSRCWLRAVRCSGRQDGAELMLSCPQPPSARAGTPRGRIQADTGLSYSSPWDMGITTVLLRAPFAPWQPAGNAMADSPPSPLEALNCLNRNHS